MGEIVGGVVGVWWGGVACVGWVWCGERGGWLWSVWVRERWVGVVCERVGVWVRRVCVCVRERVSECVRWGLCGCGG